MKLFTLLLIAQLLLASASYASESIPILGDFKAKPKNWLDKDGQAQGIMIDLLNEVTERTGIQFSFQLFPWKRAYAKSEKGEGAIIGFSKTSERMKSWDYSEPMYHDELVFVTTKSKAFQFNGLESLAGKRLAIKNGASYGDDFEAARDNGFFKLTETTDRIGQMRMLTANRVDLVLVSPGKIALESVLARNDWLQDHREEFVILEPPYKLDPNYLGIPKSMGKSHLLPMINNALSDMRKDGTHQTIVSKNIDLVIKQLKQREK